MESQTTETANEKREWSVKKHNCQDGLDILKPVIPIITRVQTWINYLQNTRSPTVSLLIYIMEDLIAVCDDLGNILNIRQCRLDPSTSENLILSAFRYKVGLSKETKPPNLPCFRVIIINDPQD